MTNVRADNSHPRSPLDRWLDHFKKAECKWLRSVRRRAELDRLNKIVTEESEAAYKSFRESNKGKPDDELQKYPQIGEIPEQRKINCMNNVVSTRAYRVAELRGLPLLQALTACGAPEAAALASEVKNDARLFTNESLVRRVEAILNVSSGISKTEGPDNDLRTSLQAQAPVQTSRSQEPSVAQTPVQQAPVKKKRGRPPIAHDLKKEALELKNNGGTNRDCAKILYTTTYPTKGQVRNVNAILKHYQRTLPQAD